jgi:hypothetical protein
VDTSVPKILPSELAKIQPRLNPAVKAFNHSPQMFVDHTQILRAFHVNTILNFSRPLKRLQAIMLAIGLSLRLQNTCSDSNWLSPATNSTSMSSPKTLSISGSTSIFSFTLSDASTAKWKTFDIHQKKRLVTQHEAFLAPSKSSVGVASTFACAIWVSAAPTGKVGAVHAGCLD